MRPTHKNKVGEKVCFISVKFYVDVDAIETAIMYLLEADYQDKAKKITRARVEKELRHRLYRGGDEEVRGCGIMDPGNWFTNLDALVKQAQYYAKKLFPEFYN